MVISLLKISVLFASIMYNKIGVVYDVASSVAMVAAEAMIQKYRYVDLVKNKDASVDLVIMLGGDGFALHAIHDFFDSDVTFYGINYGTVGFLMNAKEDELEIPQLIEKSVVFNVNPLQINLFTEGECVQRYAINDVSLLRQSSQAAKIMISVNGEKRMTSMSADGIVVCTPIGSTAYNFSLHGPLLPINCNMIALTPISPFRPRYWRGALLANTSVIELDITDAKKRPVSATCDFMQTYNVQKVVVQVNFNKVIKLLFNSNITIEERVIREQFMMHE